MSAGYQEQLDGSRSLFVRAPVVAPVAEAGVVLPVSFFGRGGTYVYRAVADADAVGGSWVQVGTAGYGRGRRRVWVSASGSVGYRVERQLADAPAWVTEWELVARRRVDVLTAAGLRAVVRECCGGAAI